MNNITSIIILSSILSFSLLPSVTNAALIFCPASESLQQTADCQKSQADQKIYQERSSALSPYSQFFDEVGVNLTVKTTESQYKTWLSNLMDAKEGYDNEKEAEKKRQEELVEQEEAEKIRKENEAEAKIKELEDRVKSLESQKTTVTTSSQVDIKPVVPVSSPTKVIEQKPVSSVAEAKPVVENPNLVETPEPAVVESISQTPPKKVGWFTRIINWFTGR